MFSHFKNRDHYPFWFELAPLLLTVALLMVQFFVFKDYTPHVPLVVGICITGIFMALKGRKWAGMEKHMYRVMKVALPTTVIILCVGMMIAASIAAGTVQTVLVYGLSILKPTVFLPATCILTTVVSLATGTSWGTVGTVGLAMVGIGEALGVPMHWTVGAICSGAFFGDKMSPLSDTTNLSPAVAGTDIWSHIKAMLPNTIPAYAITIVVYALVSLHYGGDAGEGSLATRELFRQLMMEHFRIGWITLIPAVVVIYMGFRKYSVMGTLCTGIFLAVLLAVVYQGVKLSAVSDILMNGFKAHTGQEAMDKLLSKGGIMSMTWVITMMMLSLAFVGCLEAYGTFRAILAKLNVLIRSRFSLVATAASAVLIVGLVAGEIYTSLVLPGRLMKGKFAEMGYDRAILSRTLEDWGTLVSPLIPWNNGGAFVTATLGLSTFIYAPFALFCWLSPLIGLIYAAFGWFTPKDPRGPQTLADEDMEEIADEVDDYMV